MKRNNFLIFKLFNFYILAAAMLMTGCNEEPDGSNLFSSDQKTIAELLRDRSDLSAFYRILEKGGFDKYMGTYGNYTCFAPLNDGVDSYLDSLYNDQSYLISKAKVKHNGITEAANWNSLDVMAKVDLMSDSLCDDIARFHLSGEEHLQVDLDGTATTWTTMKTGRSIRVGTFGENAYNKEFVGLTSLNDVSAIIDGDIEAVNGILQICSNVIPRSDRTTDDQMRVEGEKDLSIFYAALEATGYTDTLLIEAKRNADGTAKTYDLGTNHNDRDGNSLYYPKECMIKWTVFAETDDVFHAAGINSFNDPQDRETKSTLVDKCIEWYGNCSAWYDYINEKGITISTGDDYTNPFNVVNMFVAYHILRAGMPIDRIVYEKNAQTNASWNLCFGYEPQEYFETMLPNTLLKVWETNPKTTKNLWLNRYLTNNTLTSKLGLFGVPGDGDHVLKFAGVSVDRNNSVETLNGYIHRIKGILKYDQNARDALHERLRLDSSTFLYELINNGLRFATPAEVSTLNGGGDGNRIAFQNNYFDNIVCYNPGTLLRFCVMGAWRANNSDQFQGWDVYDFAVKLPHVPTGDYELRIIYPPMARGGLMQFYLGNSSKQSDMVAIGIPFDACANPLYDATIGWEPIEKRDDNPESDFGVACGQRMHVRGYMYAPASFSRGTYNTVTDPLTYNENDIYSAASQIVGTTNCRSEDGYGTMILRRIITTQRFEQGKDYWLRIKNLVNDSNLGWSFDFIELVPLDIVNNQTMSEDWY